jgi:hypothetical protein
LSFSLGRSSHNSSIIALSPPCCNKTASLACVRIDFEANSLSASAAHAGVVRLEDALPQIVPLVVISQIRHHPSEEDSQSTVISHLPQQIGQPLWTGN